VTMATSRPTVTTRSVAAARLAATVPVWLWLGAPGLLALALYGPLLPSLVHEWTAFPALSHGFAIPFIAGYLVWARRERLRGMAIEPTLWGLPVLVAGLGALVVGVHGQESFIARMSLPVTLLGLVLLLAGRRVVQVTWVGIVYLIFMIPLPWVTLKVVMYRSRLLDAGLSAYFLDWLGVPVYREGVLLHLPNVVLEVADDCSSIPAIAALLALGVAYGSLTRRPAAVRALLIAVTLPLAIGSNIIRITMTAAAVYYVGPWTLGTVFHHFSGTMNFMLTFLSLMLVDAVLGTVLKRWAR
jgi:exosortase